MTFTNLPIYEMSLESARAGGLTDLVAKVASAGVAAAATTYWVAGHGTYASTGGAGAANYDPNGVTPNSDKVPTQPAGFTGTYGNGPEPGALSPSLTSMLKTATQAIFILVSNTSGANSLTITPVAGKYPPAGQAGKVASNVATVVPLGKVGVLGPFTSSELSQADGTYQFTCTGTTPTGFLLAVRVDHRSS